MAGAVDYQRLRDDIGASITVLSDGEAALIFTEAGESYTSVAAIKANTRVIAIGRLLASSAKLTSYRQNNTQENLSDVFKNLKALLELWQEKLEYVAQAELGGAARFGSTRRIPTRLKEYPDA